MNKLLSVRTWHDLEACLTDLYQLPGYAAARQDAAQRAGLPAASAGDAAGEVVRQIRTGGLGALPQPREFTGPRRFFRAVGASNRVYGGEWWFEEDQLLHLEHGMSRVLFGRERVDAIRAALREVTAVSIEWNPFTELWMLDLPAGERTTGFVSRAAPQPYSQRSLPSDPARRLLIGGVLQIFFPVKNPLWVHRHT